MKTKIVLMLVVATAMLAGGNVARGDIVTRSIQAEYDDAEEYLNTLYPPDDPDWPDYTQGRGWLDSSDLELGSEGDGGLGWQAIAMQYDQLGIPQGATITSAKLTFTVDDSGVEGESNDFTILAEAADNAAVYGYSFDAPFWPAYAWLDSYDITGRARTAASVSWAPAALPAVGTTLDTPDIASLIQEVVNRPGWSENNRLTLMIYPDVYLDLPDPSTGGTTTVQEIEFEAGPGADSATLTVEYIADPKAPFVDAGADMITWSGQAVQLDPNVVNRDVTALTYLWSADDPCAVFDPSADVNDPTVTITKPALTLTTVSIANPGFEDPVLGDTAFSNSLDNQGWGYFDNGGSQGSWNPGPEEDYGGSAPEGANVGWANPGGVGVPGGLAQVLTDAEAVLKAETTYTLIVDIGNCSGYPWGGYKVQLLAGGTPHTPGTGDPTGPVTGGTLLAEDNNSLTIPEGTFKTSTVTYSYNPELHSDLLGEPLQIRLLSLGNVNPGDYTEADFDDVWLTAEGPTPSPYVVTLTLAVNNEGSTRPDVEDTMTIDVYDDACEAARIGKGLAADNPGDFDGNCITDANDLAELATKWLDDTGLTGPVVK